MSTPPSSPLVVVEGGATEEEVAALLAVLTVSAAAADATERPRRATRSAWAAPARSMRRTPPHGPGGWRASGLPR